jgi:hypothetical protein
MVVDGVGRRYAPSSEGLPALAARIPTRPLTTPLRPGGSYTTVLAFELPADVTHPRLLVTDEEPITRLLIGHEGSPGHKKIYFELG